MAKVKCNTCSNFCELMRNGWVDTYLCREHAENIFDGIDYDEVVDTDPNSECYCAEYQEKD